MIHSRARLSIQPDHPGRTGQGPERKDSPHLTDRPVRPVEAAPAAPPMSRFMTQLAERVGREAFAKYFEHQTRLRYSDGLLEVVVPTGFVAELIGRKFSQDLLHAAREELSLSPAHADAAVELNFRVDAGAFGNGHAGPGSTPPAPRTSPTAAPARPVPRPPAPRVRVAPTPEPRYRLEDFVVGESNRLAYTAAERIAQPDGPRPFSHLFIHGPCGLGKTHLLRGVAARFRELRPGAAVVYLTAESFTNSYISDVRSGRIEAFRRAYRDVDLLCLDDVQFFSSKTQTQTELLHTFDAIGLSGARVVLASDEHPRKVRKLSHSLVSRFMSGMVVKIDPPEPALRERIVAGLARRRGLELAPAACALIAGRCAGAGSSASVRDMEGALTRIEAMRTLAPSLGGEGPGEIGLMLVRRALGIDEGAPPVWRQRRPVRVDQIIEEVCRTLRVEHPELLGRGRHKRVVLARTLTAHLSRQMTTLSFPEIARAMGRPNHSTVVTACQRIGRQIERDEPLDLGADAIPELAGLTVKTLAEQLRDDIGRSAAGG